MAYVSKNMLRRALRVQEIYKTQHQLGVTDVRIYKECIQPVFLISKRTFYTWLSLPAAAELRRMGEPIEAAEPGRR